jgi:hypothetical protein
MGAHPGHMRLRGYIGLQERARPRTQEVLARRAAHAAVGKLDKVLGLPHLQMAQRGCKGSAEGAQRDGAQRKRRSGGVRAHALGAEVTGIEGAGG